jgi:anti-anti-sigma factor
MARTDTEVDVSCESVPTGCCIQAVASAEAYLIRLSGSLDVASCEEVIAAIRFGEHHHPRRTVIDVEGLEFIDSTGLRLLLAASRRGELCGREVRFTRGRGYVADMLASTALDQLLPFVDAGAPA